MFHSLIVYRYFINIVLLILATLHCHVTAVVAPAPYIPAPLICLQLKLELGLWMGRRHGTSFQWCRKKQQQQRFSKGI
ncbi:GL22266 [Drosophila persimilis]|uniref:GL22266 n=1 Tax=Drosophila persimilis TaxID=7234 RepID=B4GFS2_DROPE|nr:GL22266 [Drosophila persimilis]